MMDQSALNNRSLRVWAARDTVDYDDRGLTHRKWKPFRGVGVSDQEPSADKTLQEVHTV